MGTIRDCFVFLWRNFHISSVDLSDIENKQDDCYVGGNEDLEDSTLESDQIGRHHHQSPNLEETNIDTITN